MNNQSELERAMIAGHNDDLGSMKVRRKKPHELNSNSSVDSTKLSTPHVSGNLSNYDTDDNTDKIMDMLIKTANEGEKRTRIRKNRQKDAKSNRKSCKYFVMLIGDVRGGDVRVGNTDNFPTQVEFPRISYISYSGSR